MDSTGDGERASGTVTIQTSPHSVPSPPSWLGEVAVIVHDLRRLGRLAVIGERVRFARRRFGHYEMIDFLAVLVGYAERRRADAGSLL